MLAVQFLGFIGFGASYITQKEYCQKCCVSVTSKNNAMSALAYHIVATGTTFKFIKTRT